MHIRHPVDDGQGNAEVLCRLLRSMEWRSASNNSRIEEGDSSIRVRRIAAVDIHGDWAASGTTHDNIGLMLITLGLGDPQ